MEEQLLFIVAITKSTSSLALVTTTLVKVVARIYFASRKKDSDLLESTKPEHMVVAAMGAALAGILTDTICKLEWFQEAGKRIIVITLHPPALPHFSIVNSSLQLGLVYFVLSIATSIFDHRILRADMRQKMEEKRRKCLEKSKNWICETVKDTKFTKWLKKTDRNYFDPIEPRNGV